MPSNVAKVIQLKPFDDEPALPNPVDSSRRIRAVLLDVDGTLYRQTPVRVGMALELLTMPFYGPAKASLRWRALWRYRRALEELRATPGAMQQALAQSGAAAAETGLSPREVDTLVGEWMHRRPLKYVRLMRAPGLIALLRLLARARVPVGVLSDYHAEAKIRALGLRGRFDFVLCSTDEAINALKPDPRGFLHACAIWRLPPSDVLMIGDRPDVDAAGARAAGMPCVIIGRRGSRADGSSDYLRLPSLKRLVHVLDDRS